MSLKGRLEDLDLSDIFQILSLSKRSGVLTIIRRDTTGRLVFKEGLLLYGSSDGVDKFGYTLVKKKMLSPDTLEEALESQKIDETQLPIGSVLLKVGAISKKDLQSALKGHLTDVVQNFLDWESGSFHFNVEDVENTDQLLDQGLSLDYLLMEATRLKDEAQRKKIGNQAHQEKPQEGQDPAQEDQVNQDHLNLEDFLNETLITQFIIPDNGGNTETTFPAEFIENGDSPVKSSSKKDLSLLSAMIEEVSGPTTTSEKTLLVIRYAGQMMNRIIILLVKETEIVGSGQSGITCKNGSADEKIREIKISLSIPSTFKEVIEMKSSYKGPLSDHECHQKFITHLEEEWPSEIFMMPLFDGEKVIALLYGDNLPDSTPLEDTDGLEDFVKIAGLAFENNTNNAAVSESN